MIEQKLSTLIDNLKLSNLEKQLEISEKVAQGLDKSCLFFLAFEPAFASETVAVELHSFMKTVI